LAEGKGGVDSGAGGLAEHLHSIWCVTEEDAGRGDEVNETFANECCLKRRCVSLFEAGEGRRRREKGGKKGMRAYIEDIDQRLIYHECFEQ